MKVLQIAGAAALFLGWAASAHAQPVSMPAADVFGSLGWLNVHKADLDHYNSWFNRSLHVAGTFGWYWNEHLKTELEAAASTRARLYGSRETFINGQRVFIASESTLTTRRVTASQQYQFGHNAWFHPHLAAGVDLTWERTRQVDRPYYIFDPVLRYNRLIDENVTHPARVDLRVRPFVATGFKAYVTERAFFRSDIRFVARRRLDEVLLRFGFGVDF